MMDANLTLEISFVIEEVIVIGQLKDRPIGLLHEFFNVLYEFAEAFPNVRRSTLRFAQVRLARFNITQYIWRKFGDEDQSLYHI